MKITIIYTQHLVQIYTIQQRKTQLKHFTLLMWDIDTHNELLYSSKKQWNLAICEKIDGHGGMIISEINKTER